MFFQENKCGSEVKIDGDKRIKAMIEFKWERYKNRVPVIRDVDIDALAEAVIEEYNPRMLISAMPIDHMHFNEFYLGPKVRFQDIFYCNGEDMILGAVSFNDNEYMSVFDKERERVDKINLERGTVVLDNVLTEAFKETQQTFTGLHEAWHWIMHQRYFSRNASQNQKKTEFKTACRSKAINGQSKRFLETEEDFLEHQANYFASATVMPKRAVLGVAQEIFDELRVKTSERSYILERSVASYRKRHEIVTEYARRFAVSKPTAKIWLHKLGLIVNEVKNIVLESINFDNRIYAHLF